MKFMPAESETPQENIHNIPISSRVNEVPDSIRFNFRHKKALIWNSRSDQGEFNKKQKLQRRKMTRYTLKGARFTT
jgi:hypothetical protein